jgi:site-specific recombinase XerD
MTRADLTLVNDQAGLALALDLPTRSLATRWLLAYESKRTREAYRDALVRFSRFMEHGEPGGVLKAKRAHIDLWARTMEAEGLKPATRARNLAAVSSFYSYAVSEGELEQNPAEAVRRPKVSDISPRLGLDLTTSRNVRPAVEAMSAQHRAAFALLFCEGLRVSEACAVKPSDFTESLGHRVLMTKGKGGAIEPVAVPPLAWRLMSEAVEQAEALGCTVLHGPKGEQLSRFQVSRMVARIGKAANLGRPLTPHDLRHGAATAALEAGEPLHQVQAHLRHRDPKTTQRYNRNRQRLDNSAAYGLAQAIS